MCQNYLGENSRVYVVRNCQQLESKNEELFIAVFRGQFSVVAKGIEKSTDQYVVAKLLEVNSDTEEAVSREFDNLRSLRHERVVTLLAALRPAPSIAVLVMEKLQGADILTYFTSRHEYSEQMVATVVTQVRENRK